MFTRSLIYKNYTITIKYNMNKILIKPKPQLQILHKIELEKKI